MVKSADGRGYLHAGLFLATEVSHRSRGLVWCSAKLKSDYVLHVRTFRYQHRLYTT